MDNARQKLVPFVLVTVIICCDISAHLLIITEPPEVEVLANQGFYLTCSALAVLKSDDLKLKFIFKNGSELNINEGYIIVLNQSAVQLIQPGLSSEFDGCYISCYSQNNESFEAKVSIKERHPVPRIIHYEFWNWEELRFEWGFANANRMLETKFRGWYRDSSAKDFTECDGGSNPNECRVKKKLFDIAPTAGIVHIKVNGTNRLENISTDGILFPMSKYIRPGKVKNLRVKHLHENFSICYACFRAPQRESISYNITTACNNGQFQMSKEEMPVEYHQIQTEIIVPLHGLPADSNCSLSINARPSQGGFWGPVEAYAFRTLETVPLAAPEICKSCFYLQMTSNNLQIAVIYFKPLSRCLARGRVTGYKAQYMDLHKRWRSLLDPSSFMLKLQNLSTTDDYRLTIEARTATGFNETLQTPVLVIERANNLQFRVERYVVIVKNSTTVASSWDRLEGASSYTLFWCEGREQTCDTVLNWIELPANYTSYEINLGSGLEADRCLFGIGAAWNRHNSGIQWSKDIYDFHAIALPPSIELNMTTSNEILLCLHKPEPVPRMSGFIVKYFVYFCPVLTADDLQCIGELKQIEADGWMGKVLLSDLRSNQKYLVLASSWTAAGPSTHNNTKVLTTDAGSTLSAGLIVLVVVGSVVCLVLIVVGLCTLIRFYQQSVVRYKQWMTVGITTPPVRTANTEGDCRPDNGNNGEFAAATENEYPLTKQNEDLEAVSEKIEERSLKELAQVDNLPVLRQRNLFNIPLFTEERMLPLVDRFNIHGSSPSIMLHNRGPLPTIERQRILPTIRGKPAYIKPQQRDDSDVSSEAIPMISSMESESLKEKVDDSSISTDSAPYSYVRRHCADSGCLETLLSQAAPVKFEELPEESTEFGEDSIRDEEEQEEEENCSTISVSECVKSVKTMDSFQHLPSLDSQVC